MKGGRETPRQKMISILYLVLLAMLALNVSSSVLEGFTIVDNNLHTSIQSSEVKNKALYADFQDLYDQNPDKTRAWLDEARLVKKKSDDFYKYIEKFKVEIIKMTDNENANDSGYVRQIKAKDDMDTPAEYALVKGNGKILKQKIEDYRNFLVNSSANNPMKQKMYQAFFNTGKTNDGKPWEIALFEMMPVSAVITILTNYQNNIRASEAEMIQHLKSQTAAPRFNINKIKAVVVPNDRFVIRGGSYKAQILLSLADSTEVPEYYVDGFTVTDGLYQMYCDKKGSFNYTGQIDFTAIDGTISSYPFKGDYVVEDPAATIANEDMNILYRGIDNKFSISAPGVEPDSLSVRVSGGIVKKVAGKYLIRVNQDKNVNIKVYAKIDGKDLLMGGGIYRVKYLPDPKSYLRYTDVGGITRLVQDAQLSRRLLKEKGVSLIASYGKDELIRANFNIISFSMLTALGSVNVNGSRFSAKQLSDIDKLKDGDVFTLKNIKAVGPDGKVRTLGLIQIQL